jgi:uncharacterized protein YPO0396
MGIDVRFYYASLVAIFLFFLLGLLIGVGLSRQPAVERLAAHIEKQLRQYREEVNKQLQARDKLIRSLQDEIVSAQAKDKVAGAVLAHDLTAVPQRFIALQECSHLCDSSRER